MVHGALVMNPNPIRAPASGVRGEPASSHRARRLAINDLFRAVFHVAQSVQDDPQPNGRTKSGEAAHPGAHPARAEAQQIFFNNKALGLAPRCGAHYTFTVADISTHSTKSTHATTISRYSNHRLWATAPAPSPRERADRSTHVCISHARHHRGSAPTRYRAPPRRIGHARSRPPSTSRTHTHTRKTSPPPKASPKNKTRASTHTHTRTRQQPRAIRAHASPSAVCLGA